MPPLGPPRLLVVDDDPEVRALVTTVLTEDGYTVDTAHDGIAAVAALRAARPDAIVLDLNMPGMTGQDFLALYRQLPGPHVPVIVLSGAGYGVRQTVAAGGVAAAVLPKPFGVDRLLDLVATCLAHREPAKQRIDRAA